MKKLKITIPTELIEEIHKMYGDATENWLNNQFNDLGYEVEDIIIKNIPIVNWNLDSNIYSTNTTKKFKVIKKICLEIKEDKEYDNRR